MQSAQNSQKAAQHYAYVQREERKREESKGAR